jgi:hypothetical protein
MTFVGSPAAIVLASAVLAPCCHAPDTPTLPDSAVEINDNGAWTWFSDDRVIIHDNQLIVGSVRSVGEYQRSKALPGWGNLEIARLDLVTGEVAAAVVHERFEQDDHDGPALLPLADDRLLAVYTKHSVERTIYSRSSASHDPLTWGEVREFTSPGVQRSWKGDNVTYSNLFRWPGGRIYDFYRGFDQDPNYAYSDDEGATWTYGGRLLEGYDDYSPYLRYAYDGEGTLHFIATEDHPRHHDTSIYHGYLRDDVIFDSSGVALAELGHTTDAPLAVWDLSLVYPADPDHVAWTVDIELDGERRPYIAYSVQRDGAGLPFEHGGMDLRYHYGRWDGSEWTTDEIAHAGTRLYAREEDYAALAALDPHDPNVIYISTNAEPETGAPLISGADCERHYELYRGHKPGPGQAWEWAPLTSDSDVDNIRPIVPKWDDPRTALVWMRGTYVRHHGEWSTKVMAAILN